MRGLKNIYLLISLAFVFAFKIEQTFAASSCGLDLILGKIEKLASESKNSETQQLSNDQLMDAYRTQFQHRGATTPAEMASIRNKWEPTALTNPSEHNSLHYQYLIHAIAENEARHYQLIETFYSMARTGIVQTLDSFIDLIKEPQRINEKPMISASLISSEKNETFQSSGIILEAPASNIVATSPQDMGSVHVLKPGMSKENALREFKVLQQKHGLATPAQLLAATRDSSYNEVIVATGKTGQKIRISGVFIKIDSEGAPFSSPQRTQELQNLAHRLNVPIVYIKDTVRQYPNEPIKIVSDYLNSEPVMITLQRDGIRHVLSLKEGSISHLGQYSAYSEFGKRMATSEKSKAIFIEALRREAEKNSEIKTWLEKLGF